MIQIKQIGPMIHIAGHAGTPPDLICEDVTALFQTLIMATIELAEDQIEYRVEKGNAFLTYKGTLSEPAQLLRESFFVGVCAISNTHPDKVQVTRQERQ